MPKKGARKRPRPLQAPARTASPAERTLEDLGGIAGLLQTLAGAWPEELNAADFEAVFSLVVGRCKNEFGGARFLAYLCRALLDESASKAFRSEPLAVRRVELMMKAGIRQAPFLLDDLRLVEQLAAALHEPGVIVADPAAKSGTRRIVVPETFGSETFLPIVRKEELNPWRKLIKQSMEAAGKSLARSKPGAPRVDRVNKRGVLERVERGTQEIAARGGKRGARKKALAIEADRSGDVVSVDTVIQRIKRAKRGH